MKIWKNLDHSYGENKIELNNYKLNNSTLNYTLINQFF